MSVVVLPVALLVLAAVDDAVATTAPAGGSGVTSPVVGEPLIGLAWGSLGLSLLVIVVALFFISAYHRRLLRIISWAVRHGAPVGTSSELVAGRAPQVAGQGLGADAAPFGVTSDVDGSEATPGQDVTFSAIGGDPAKDRATISWSSEGGKPANGTGATFVTRAPTSGKLTVLATWDSETPVTHSVTVGTVSAPGSDGPAGIVLPFAIRGWGGFVVTVLGIGVVVALMFAKVISESAGVGILGTLLGLGAASAAGAAKEDNAGAKAGSSAEKGTES